MSPDKAEQSDKARKLIGYRRYSDEPLYILHPSEDHTLRASSAFKELGILPEGHELISVAEARKRGRIR